MIMTNNDDKKFFRAYAPLNVNQIHPEGWLNKWQQVVGNSWTLTYAQNQVPGVYDKFWNRNETSEFIFDENDQTLTLCDFTSYFADGLVRYARMNPGSQLEKEWLEWLDKLLASQDEDGYIGAFAKGVRWEYWLEIFSQSLVIDSMLYWYELHGDEELLGRCEKAIKCIMKAWDNPDGKPFAMDNVRHGRRRRSKHRDNRQQQ